MKKITLLLALLISSIGFSQTYDLLESFNGTGYEGAFGGTSAEYVADPTDASTQVVKITSTDGTGEVWQGINVVLTDNFTLTSATQLTMQLDVYSTSAITIAPKAQGGLSGAPESVTSVAHSGGGWETLTFSFDKSLDGKVPADGDYADFALHINWDTAGNSFGTPDGRVFYIKNLKGLIAASDNGGGSSDSDVALGFETEETGGINGGPFGAMAAPSIVDGTGANTSKVLEIIGNSSGEVWQGINLNLSNNVDLSSTQTMTIDVKSASAITFLVKVNGGIGGAAEAAAEVTHNGDGTWQTLSFTFNSALDNKAAAANGVYSSFVVHAYWTAGQTIFDNVTKDERTFYIDNITGPEAGEVAADPVPTDAPATPPSYAANNVISLYSDAYTTTGGLNDVDWDEGATSEEISVAGNNILKLKMGNFIGFDFGEYIDATAMTHLHMDYWIGEDWTDGQVFNPKLSNHGATNENDDIVESNAKDIGNPITSQEQVKNWQSLDIALGTSNEFPRAVLRQFLITVAGKAPTAYIDNVYLYVSGTASVANNSLLGFSMYPNPASDRLNISAKETIQRADVFNVLGKKVMSVNVNKTKASLDISNLNSGIYLVKYDVNGTAGTAKFIKQ